MFALNSGCLWPGRAVLMVNISSLLSLGSEASWAVMWWGSFGMVHAAGPFGRAVCLVLMSWIHATCEITQRESLLTSSGALHHSWYLGLFCNWASTYFRIFIPQKNSCWTIFAALTRQYRRIETDCRNFLLTFSWLFGGLTPRFPVWLHCCWCLGRISASAGSCF